MKELDLLLACWLDTQFEQASRDLRSQFEALLELPDPLLAGYLLGGQRPERADLAALVESIRGGSGVMSSAAAGWEPSCRDHAPSVVGAWRHRRPVLSPYVRCS